MLSQLCACTVVDVRDDSDEFNNVRVLEAYGIAAMKLDTGILQRSNSNLFEIPPPKKRNSEARSLRKSAPSSASERAPEILLTPRAQM